MRSPFTITFNDLIREQEKQVDHFKELLEDKRKSGLTNLDAIHRKIYLADRTRQLLLRFKKNPQLDLNLENTQLNQR